MLLASSGWRPRLLLNVLQCGGQLPISAQNASVNILKGPDVKPWGPEVNVKKSIMIPLFPSVFRCLRHSFVSQWASLIYII